MAQSEDSAAIERLAAYIRGERGDLEPGDLDRVYAELERLRAIEQRAQNVARAPIQRSSAPPLRSDGAEPL